MFMKSLSEDKLAYLSYFWWTEHYKLAQRDHFCLLCSALDQSSLPKQKVYEEFSDWWNVTVCDFPKYKWRR